jgi:hypothetical protein
MTRPLAGKTTLAAVCLALFVPLLLIPSGDAQVRSGLQRGDRGGASGGDGGAAAAALPELQCRLNRREPVLDYEFRFYAPYWIDIPLRRLYGGGQRFSITTVIDPVSIEGAEPIRIDDTFTLSKPVPEGIRGDFELSSAFALGEGRYEIDWRMEDEAGRACELSWALEVKRSRQDRHVPLTVKPGEVVPARVYLFRPEPAVATSGRGLRVKLLMNLDLPSRRRARVQLWRYAPMISGLRVMSRHPALAEFAVAAFSMEQQKVLHRQEFSRRIDFPELGDAIESLTPGTVQLDTLRQGSDLEFLDELLAEELSDTGQVDAIIFVGADDRFGKRVSPETLEQTRAKGIPVFHFNSTVFLWRGAIGNAVKSLGGKEYKVRQPRELAKAVAELVAEIRARRPRRGPGL